MDKEELKPREDDDKYLGENKPCGKGMIEQLNETSQYKPLTVELLDEIIKDLSSKKYEPPMPQTSLLLFDLVSDDELVQTFLYWSRIYHFVDSVTRFNKFSERWLRVTGETFGTFLDRANGITSHPPGDKQDNNDIINTSKRDKLDSKSSSSDDEDETRRGLRNFQFSDTRKRNQSYYYAQLRHNRGGGGKNHK